MARKSSHIRRRIRGGNSANPSSYSSASSYGMAVNGNANDQFNRVMNNGSNGNTLTGIQGQRAGGRRRSKRGGFWGQVINQAIVPFGILGMQQTFNKRKHHQFNGRKTHRRRRH
jgi:hypothetical protein